MELKVISSLPERRWAVLHLDSVAAVLPDFTAFGPVSRISPEDWLFDLRSISEDSASWQQRLRRALPAALQVNSALAVAGTRMAAFLLARHGRNTISPAGREALSLSPLPLSVLPGLTASARERLLRLSLRTLGDLARLQRRYLARLLGPMGDRIYAMSCGLDLVPLNSLLPKAPEPEQTLEFFPSRRPLAA